MTFWFIHPPLSGPVSGGTIFNREVIRGGLQRTGALVPVSWSGVSNLPLLSAVKGDTVLWDSLFIAALAQSSPKPVSWAVPPFGCGHHPGVVDGLRQGMLVHYLPFNNPLLTGDERKQWELAFQTATGGMQFFMATGSEMVSQLELLHPGRPVYPCRPGVDYLFIEQRNEAYRNIPGFSVNIVTVASLLPAKRQVELLDILAEIEADWVWHVVGDCSISPSYTVRLASRIQEAGLSHRVILYGVMETPVLARLLGAMDIFAFYSAYESYGIALAEAAAIGLPIVTTEVGEANRLVVDGQSGFVVPVDKPHTFKAALQHLVCQAEFRQTCRQAAMRQPVRSWESAADDFLSGLSS